MNKTSVIVYGLYILSFILLAFNLRSTIPDGGYENLSTGIFVLLPTLLALLVLVVSVYNFRTHVLTLHKLIHGFFFVLSSVYLAYLVVVVLDIMGR